MRGRLPLLAALLFTFALLPPSDPKVYVAQVGTETGDNHVWSQSLGDWDIINASLSITDCPDAYPPPSTITFCYRSVFDNDNEGLKDEKESLSTTTTSSTSSSTTWSTKSSSDERWSTKASSKEGWSTEAWSSEPLRNAVIIQCENKIVFNLEANLTGTVELKFNYSESLDTPHVTESLYFSDEKKPVFNFTLNFLASMYQAHQAHQIPLVFRRSIESNVTNAVVFDFVFFKSSELNDSCLVELTMQNVDPLGHRDGKWWIENDVNSSVHLDDMGIAQQVDDLLDQVGSRLKFDMKIDIRDLTNTVLHYGFWVIAGLTVAIVVILLVAGLFACLFCYWPRTRTVFVQGPEKIVYMRAPTEELVVTAVKEKESTEKPKETTEKKKTKKEPRSDNAFAEEEEKPKKRKKAKEKEKAKKKEKESPFVAKKKEQKTDDCSPAEKDKSEERLKGALPAAQETSGVDSAREPSGPRLTKTTETTHDPSTIDGNVSVANKPTGSAESGWDAGSKTGTVFSRVDDVELVPLPTNQDVESKTGTGNSKTTDFSTDIDFSECKTTTTHFKD